MKFLLYILPLFLFALRNEPITPIPNSVKYDKEKAEIGKKLFFDESFSADGTISCASCHIPRYGGADPRPVSVGVFGKLGDIQSPTVYNSGFNFRQFWNGRAKDLKEQINGPTHNPVEMGLNAKRIEKILNNSQEYKIMRKIYNKHYLTFEMFQDAIAEFEKALFTPNCKFDKWLREEGNLSKEELNGYYNFKKFGCITCHNGVNIGGNSFQKMGIINPVKNRVGDRYEVTHKTSEKFVYKVPTLRNIALTAPYFHSAVTYDLAKSVNIMAYHNLGLELTKEEVKSIVAFLKTLTGIEPEILEEK